MSQPLSFKEMENREKQQRENKGRRRPMSGFSDPPSPTVDPQWVVVGAPPAPSSQGAFSDQAPQNSAFLDEELLTSLKNRLTVDGPQGRSYISNRRIEDLQAAKHRALHQSHGQNIKSRPPAPPPRPLPSPDSHRPRNSSLTSPNKLGINIYLSQTTNKYLVRKFIN